MDKVEEFLDSVEETLFNSLNSAAPDMARVQERLNHLWGNLTRYGPVNMPQLMDHLPSLGDFEVPPPPPPPPPETWYQGSLEWAENHPWKTGGIAAGVAGAGLLIGYGGVYLRTVRLRKIKEAASSRKQVVVVLGGDMPLGVPLVSDLERKGYIVIASVSSPQAADDMERRSRGYVRALVLDPTEPEGIPVFFRSMASTLTRRFPLNAAGDPFDAPLTVHSVISLLSLAPPPVQAPLECIDLHADLIPYLNATQLTPLRAIQDILPLFRNNPSGGSRNIIVCLPATATRVGLPFSAMQSISAAGTLRATEVLRREITVAGLTGKSEGMKLVNITVVDVGSFDVGPVSHLGPEEVYHSIERWSVSEKLAYGAGFAAISQRATHPTRWDNFKSRYTNTSPYGVRRKPTDVKVFLDNIAGVVSNGHFGPRFFSFNIGLGKLRNFIRGDRFSTGAGSHTYKYASWLPSLVLDALLNVPHFLVSLRNSLIAVKPHTAFDLPQLDPNATSKVPPLAPETAEVLEQHDETSSEAGSEADVESNAGDSHSSWVRLGKSETAA